MPAFRSRYCDEAVTVTSPYEDLVGYKDALRSLAMRPDVSTIVPVREEDVYVLSKYREEFTDHVETTWPTFETLARVQDRIQLFEAAEAAGVAAPETRLLDDEGEWDREWIVKPRYSLLADSYVEEYVPGQCRKSPSTTYLPADEAPDVASFQAEMQHTPLLQEYVPTTDEYGFFALYDEGEALATFQHRQCRGWSYAGGPSAYRESIRDADLERSGRALLDSLEWHGLAMVEFLRDENTGEYKLMEVNPRFWSSLPFTVQTGADFPYYYWLLSNGRPDLIDHAYEDGIGGHLLRGELLYLHSVLTDEYDLVDRPSLPEATTGVLRSIYEQPRFDYLATDDPKPFVADLLDTYDAYKAL